MGEFRKLLAEERDLEKVVSKIKASVLEYRRLQEKEEEDFRKELVRLETRARKVLGSVRRTVEAGKKDLEAVLAEKYYEHIEPGLRAAVEWLLEGSPRMEEVELEPKPEKEEGDGDE